jgi:hypothetical protein
MAKAGKRKVKEQPPPRKQRDRRQGDSNLGLPGVLDIPTDREYLQAYRYASGLGYLRGPNAQP